MPFALLAALVLAAPHVPADAAVVLEQLPLAPSSAAAREVAALSAELKRAPGDLPTALKLARRWLEEGRIQSDPRMTSWAMAALAPWWSLPSPPPEVLVLRAVIHQRVHDFDAALTDLTAALALRPKDAQAWLTLASLRQVRGDYAGARAACGRVSNLADDLVAVTCLAGVASLTGSARPSAALLRRLVDANPNAPPAELGWAAVTLAEADARAGEPRAEPDFRAALARDARDPYTLAAYADWLSVAGRDADAARLLEGSERADNLLLRLAIAESHLGAPKLGEHVAMLKARFDASRRRGESVHRREEAMFALHLEHDAPRALALARANWDVQKEPADAKILLEAALAAHDAAAARPPLDFIAANHLEGADLAALATQLEEARHASR